MRKFTFILFLITTISFSCRKTNDEDRAAFVPVDTYVNINLPQYQALNISGGWAYANGGIKGLIIYRRGTDEFVAFDRNCTYNDANSCGFASVDSSNVLINCACDGSVYNIFDGSVSQGPATLPLRQYNASFDGNNTVRVFN